jgi:hypothetical protein
VSVKQLSNTASLKRKWRLRLTKLNKQEYRKVVSKSKMKLLLKGEKGIIKKSQGQVPVAHL